MSEKDGGRGSTGIRGEKLTRAECSRELRNALLGVEYDGTLDLSDADAIAGAFSARGGRL